MAVGGINLGRRDADAPPLRRLLPMEPLALRRSLDAWLARMRVKPRIVAEFADSGLLKVFGADGIGVFPAPTAVEDAVCAQYGLQVVGRVPELKERFYAITAERRLSHPAVVAISQSARDALFGADKTTALVAKRSKRRNPSRAT